MTNVYTETTCCEKCWYAKEEICRCQCGGRNHGILRQDGAVQPIRTRRVKAYRYQLEAVVYCPNDAFIMTQKAVEKELKELNGRDYFVELAPKAAFNWPELTAYVDRANHWHRPMLIWKKI